MTIQERLRYKKQYINLLIFTYNESSSVFFRECIAYAINDELSDLARIKKKYIHN